MIWDDDGFQGFRCRCGEWVAVMHAECRAYLPPELDIEEREQ